MDDFIKQIAKDAGGRKSLAEQLSERGQPITPQAISQWKKVPVERARDVAAVTGRQLHELRPDIWEAPAVGAAQ